MLSKIMHYFLGCEWKQTSSISGFGFFDSIQNCKVCGEPRIVTISNGFRDDWFRSYGAKITVYSKPKELPNRFIERGE